MDQCIDLLREITMPSSAVSRTEMRKDIVKCLLHNFSKYLENMACRTWFHNVSNYNVNPPSTSNGTAHVIEDPRIEYARLLQIIYEKLSEFLCDARVTCDDEYTLISIQNLSSISSSLQFYVLTGVLPYLEKGVGPPISTRSTIIKSWKLLTDDVCLQKLMLSDALRTIMGLVRCNECLAVEIVKRYLADIICAAYQNDHVGGDSTDVFKYLDEVEASSFRPIFISTLLSLCKASSMQSAPPIWFTMNIGRRLSKILQSPSGLRDTLLAYETMGGESFWQNLQMLTRIGQHFATVPSGCKRMAYYENISKQFINVIQFDKSDRESGYIRLFSIFIDHMFKKDAMAGNVFILDYIFKPWEKLNEARVRINSDYFAVPLRILSLILGRKDCCPELILQSSRLFEVVPSLLDIISVSDASVLVTTLVTEITGNAKIVLKALFPKVENIGEFLFAYLESSNPLRTINTTAKLITAIDEEPAVTEIINSVAIAREDVLLRRLDAILLLLQEMPKVISSGILLEILCSSIINWNKSLLSTESLRFVATDDNSDDWKRMASHTVTLFCFEHFDKIEVDFTDEQLVVKIINILSTIFASLTEAIVQERCTEVALDVRSSADKDILNINECRGITAKMIIALSASVIGGGTATEEAYDCLHDLSRKIYDFTEVACSLSQMADACEQAKEVLNLMQLVGIKVAQNTVQEKSVSKKSTSLSFDSLFLDLDDELEPTRGYALIQLCRALRSKHPDAITNMAKLFDKAVDLLSDQDSYVFLAAINCLAEIAVYDANVYLSKLLDLFSKLSLKNRTEDSNPACDQKTLYDHMVITRGKLAEATGKVFIQLGDISPAWLQKAFNVFFNGVSETDEIIRASCLSVLSDLIISCRGRGIEKYLDELFILVHDMLQHDESSLVRRSCVNLVRQCIRSSNDGLFEVIGNRIRDIRRSVSWLSKWDKDHVVRLHAELCLEEIQYCVKQIVKNENRQQVRIINIK